MFISSIIYLVTWALPMQSAVRWLISSSSVWGVPGGVVVKALCYKTEGRWFNSPSGNTIFSNYLILPAALGSGVYSASYRNEYQKQKKCFWAVKSGRCVRLTLPPWADCLDNVGFSTSQQPYRPPRPVTGTALLNSSGVNNFIHISNISMPILGPTEKPCLNKHMKLWVYLDSWT
jgi:hypothetical protein